jgi:hypothetical protein
MLAFEFPYAAARAIVRFTTHTKIGEVETAFGIDGQRVFLEFALPGTGRRVHAEPDEDARLPQRESGDEGAILLSIDDGPAVRLLVKDGSVFDETGAKQFVDERLAELYEPLRALAETLPERLRGRATRVVAPGKSSSNAATFADDDGFWSCVGHATEYGAELGGTVGFVSGTVVGGLSGGAPAILTGPAGGVAGAAGGAAAGFLGGLAIC